MTALSGATAPTILRDGVHRKVLHERADGGVVGLAVGETVILLLPPLHSLGVSTEAMRECQQNNNLADG